MNDFKKHDVRIAIVDDHKIFIDGIKSILQDQPQLNIVAEAYSGNHIESDIVTIVLKKSLQKLYYSVQMLSPGTKIICQELKHPKKWVDHLIHYGIVEKEDRLIAVKKLTNIFCKMIVETANKYEHFNYEGCKEFLAK